MYVPSNTVNYSFIYKKQSYPSGTNIVFNGKCFLEENEVILNNATVKWLYSIGCDEYFVDNENIYTCKSWDFRTRIVKIIAINNKQPIVKMKKEIVWTDDMVTKTLWYIVIMLVAIIFNDRVLIWIFATLIWYGITFKNTK